MSKMNELTTTLDELAAVGLSLRQCGEQLLQLSNSIKEAFSEPCASVPEMPEQTAPTYSFTDIRGALASKSNEGFKNEVKALLAKYGASKLSEINPEDYKALMEDVGGLSHE